MSAPAAEVDFCSECAGTGAVCSTGEIVEECDVCLGSGHFDPESETAVQGPCSQPGCAGCCLLTLWTIYDRPADYPESFVLRAWHLMRGSAAGSVPGLAQEAPSLEAARALLPAGLSLTPLPRNERDDPTIVETWV